MRRVRAYYEHMKILRWGGREVDPQHIRAALHICRGYVADTRQMCRFKYGYTHVRSPLSSADLPESNRV